MKRQLAFLGFLGARLSSAGNALRRRLARRYLCPPRPDDIYVAAFPNSGSSLIQMMLYQLTTDGSMDFSHIESISPTYELEIEAGNGELLAALPSPRLFKTYDLPHQLPRQGRFIYLVRNVRNVATSSYRRHTLFSGMDGAHEPFIDQFLAGKTFYGSWFEHLEAWWPRRHDDNVLLLVYEAVAADLEAALGEVAEFCGIKLDPDRVPRILEHCSDEALQRYNEKLDPRLHRLSRRPEGSFIREGKAGSGESVLSARQQALLEKKLRATRRRLRCSADDPASRLLRA